MRDTSAWVLYFKFAKDLQNTFLEEHLWRLVLDFISFVLVQVINNTLYWLAFKIYRPEFVICIFDMFFEIIFQTLAVTEAPIISLVQSLVKQMFLVIAEGIPRRCSSRKIIWSIPVINAKRINFINNGQMSWGYVFILYFLVSIKI